MKGRLLRAMGASGGEVLRGALQTLLPPDVDLRHAGFAPRIVCPTQGRLTLRLG